MRTFNCWGPRVFIEHLMMSDHFMGWALTWALTWAMSGPRP